MTLEQLQEIFPEATLDTWHQHPNGGGWVQNTAHVDEFAYVGKDALVFGNARRLRCLEMLWCMEDGVFIISHNPSGEITS